MPGKTRPDKIPPRGKSDWAAIDAMTGEEADAAALADPDSPPPEPNATLHSMARVKRIRLALRLSQEEFSRRFHIPSATLSAWERHEREPDAVATAFLDAISADPEGLADALAAASNPAAVK